MSVFDAPHVSCKTSMIGDHIVKWPKNYTPLPAGYLVVWSELVEHFVGVAPNDREGPIFCDKYACRRWCFENSKKADLPMIDLDTIKAICSFWVVEDQDMPEERWNEIKEESA